MNPLGTEPLAIFEGWYAEAVATGAPFPDAMTLASATQDGKPSARIVLFKGVVDGRVLFVSNYTSRKGDELAANPRAALVFFWPALDRQVRIEGSVTRAPAVMSDRYFQARALESQLGAWASPQSRPLESRAVLEENVAAAAARFAGRAVERPPFWGGYLVFPECVEFWLGQSARLHDRFLYRRQGESWLVDRLGP